MTMIQALLQAGSGSANILYGLIPVIILISVIIVLIGLLPDNTSPTASGRRGFLAAIVGISVVGLLVSFLMPIVNEQIYTTDIGYSLLRIESGETYQLNGEETYTGVNIEETGELTLTSASTLTIIG